MTTTSSARSIAIFTVALALATAVSAAEPAYVGTWGRDAAQCKVPQDREGAPTILAARRYDSHEAHCAFNSVKKSAGAWKVNARCSVEGDRQTDTFTLRVSGDTLTMTRGKTSQTLIRCR